MTPKVLLSQGSKPIPVEGESPARREDRRESSSSADLRMWDTHDMGGELRTPDVKEGEEGRGLGLETPMEGDVERAAAADGDELEAMKEGCDSPRLRGLDWDADVKRCWSGGEANMTVRPLK